MALNRLQFPDFYKRGEATSGRHKLMSLKSHIQITFVKHEIRDPIHGFIRFDSHEREVINSAPYQRLREIHQLAMTYLVYPGATHKRFEHCLGVMELASRIYDTVTDPANIYRDSVRALFSSLNPHRLYYWRTVLRMAALCHDLGHLPFSMGRRISSRRGGSTSGLLWKLFGVQRCSRAGDC